MTKKKIIDSPTTAYLSALGGIEIKKIEYGIDDYVICVSGTMGNKKVPHRVKIRYNANGEPFFILYGRRYYLKDALKTN